MKRILIVEDVASTLREFVSLLQEEFPDAVIDAAATADVAKQLIEGDGANSAYDAAILDFKIPAKLGEIPEVDESTCLLLQTKAKHTIVAHITGYPGDPRVEEHMDRIHKQRLGLPAFSLCKADADYAVRLVQNLRTKFLEREMEDLVVSIGGEQGASAPHSRSGAMARGHGITHRLMIWIEEVGTHWQEFDEVFKDKVRARFEVDETSQPVSLSLR